MAPGVRWHVPRSWVLMKLSALKSSKVDAAESIFGGLASLGSKLCRMNFFKNPFLAPVVEGKLRSCDLCLLSLLSQEPLPEIVGCVFTSCICQSHFDFRKGSLSPLGLPVGLKSVYSIMPQTCFGEIVSSCLFCLHRWPPEFLCWLFLAEATWSQGKLLP